MVVMFKVGGGGSDAQRSTSPACVNLQALNHELLLPRGVGGGGGEVAVVAGGGDHNGQRATMLGPCVT